MRDERDIILKPKNKNKAKKTKIKKKGENKNPLTKDPTTTSLIPFIGNIIVEDDGLSNNGITSSPTHSVEDEPSQRFL